MCRISSAITVHLYVDEICGETDANGKVKRLDLAPVWRYCNEKFGVVDGWEVFFVKAWKVKAEVGKYNPPTNRGTASILKSCGVMDMFPDGSLEGVDDFPGHISRAAAARRW